MAADDALSIICKEVGNHKRTPLNSCDVLSSIGWKHTVHSNKYCEFRGAIAHVVAIAIIIIVCIIVVIIVVCISVVVIIIIMPDLWS
jgi:hypothetical protein